MVRKRQVWLTPVDVDLLVTALEDWSARQEEAVTMMNRSQWRASKFTQRRIDEMIDRLRPGIDA